MADFGDEAGKDVLDNITRMARMPFDEMVRIMLRKMLNGSKNFEPQYNKEGKVESIDLPFDSLRERALAMDVMKQEGIEFEKSGSKVNVQHYLKIKPEDHERFQQAMQDRLAEIERAKYSPSHDQTLENIRKEPADKDYVDFAKDMGKEGAIPSTELVKLGDEPTFGEVNDVVTPNQRKIEKILNMREHGATAVERETADRALDRVLSKEGLTRQQVGLEEPFNPQAYKSWDGMDPDGRTRQVEGLWKDWMKDEVNNLPDNLNIGQFCDQIAERGIGVDVAKGGGYQLYDPLNPHHRINLKNLDAKYSDEKLGLRSKETAYEEKSRESRDRSDRLSRERDLGEIGDKEIPSQQLITR